MANPGQTRSTLSDGPLTPLTRWGPGIERAIQRVIAGLCLYYGIVASSWGVANLSPDDIDLAALLAAGVLTLLVVSVRAWHTRIGTPDVVATNLAMVATLVVNAGAGSEGIGPRVGPAFVLMTTSLLIAALTLPWSTYWRCAALTGAVYVLGRYAGGTTADLGFGLDEVVSTSSTVGAAGLILTFYRRAGRRADEALRVRLEVGRIDAQAAAAAHAEAEERRILHDEIIAALVSIEHAGPAADPRRAAEVASRARRGLDRRPPSPADEHLPRWLTDAAGRRIPVTFDIDPAASMSGAVPPEVTVAIAGAVREALRNVERHAAADSVRVAISPHDDGARVTVEDDGRGLRRDHTAGFGITQSIIARMALVGGRAHVGTSAAGGTTVELTWSSDGVADTPEPSESLAKVGSRRRFVHSVTLVALAGQLWLVGRHLGRPADIAVAVCALAFIGAVSHLAARRTIGTRAVTAIIVADGLLLTWGLWSAGDGALLGFRSWIVELTCVVIFTLTFFVPIRALLSLAGVLAAVVAARATQDPAVTLGQAIDAMLQPLFYAVTLGATAWGFRTVSVDIAREESRAVLEVEAEAARAATASRDQERFDHLRARLDPFFEAVENGTLDVTAPDVVDRARALALQVRDEMYLPGLLDDDLRDLLAAARESGTSITIRETASEESGEAVRLLLRSAIDPATVRQATLSLPSSGASYIRLVIVPAADEPRSDQLVRTLDPLGVEIEALEHATVITVPVSPAGAPRRGPS